MKSLQRKLFDIIEPGQTDNILNRTFSIFIMTLILLNVLLVILETVDVIYSEYYLIFEILEIISVFIFTVEYLLRLWICTLNPKYSAPVVGRIRYALTPLAIVDLLAIAPFYLPMLLPFDLRFIRALRLTRMLRVLKIGRYSESLKTFYSVLSAKRAEIFIVLFVMFILLITSAVIMYYVENDAQPEAFSNIPQAMWWGIATLTTVGYGDIFPITPLGKIFATVIAILGIGMFALPAGILGSGFIEELQKKKNIATKCPHCGKDI
jgi:voltage-gated potassium channel